MTANPTQAEVRARRSDARANRERVLEAARACFGDDIDAQMQDVARRAGVGVGTVYRHFPSKEALMVAMAVSCIQEVLEQARAGLAMEDAWQGLEHFVWGASAKLAADAVSVEAMAGQLHAEEIEHNKAELSQAMVELAARAQRAGTLRGDLAPAQVGMVLKHMAGAVRGAEISGFEWRSYVRVVLDGLRA